LRRLDTSERDRVSKVQAQIGAALRLARELERAFAPAPHLARELLVAGVVELELVAPEPTESAERLGKPRRKEPEVLLGCEPTEAVETVVRLDRQQVDEVSASARPKSARTLSAASSSPARSEPGARARPETTACRRLGGCRDAKPSVSAMRCEMIRQSS
jgi:hypothetical protein